jgi:hypothetical protein
VAYRGCGGRFISNGFMRESLKVQRIVEQAIKAANAQAPAPVLGEEFADEDALKAEGRHYPWCGSSPIGPSCWCEEDK